jgi:hypothetical protein
MNGRGELVSTIMWFILIRSWVSSQLFLLFLKGAILIGPSAIFLEHWACPEWKHLFGPQSQNRNKCVPIVFTLSVYIHGSWTFSKPYVTKPKRCWKHLGECIWEHFEKKGKKQASLTQKKVLKKGITFNVLLWTQVILDESFLVLWNIIKKKFTFVLKNKVF